ncbi:hypothetical protein [Ferrimonas sediminum]|nr:hypothetical protein [Ferrimonas sediminum]
MSSEAKAPVRPGNGLPVLAGIHADETADKGAGMKLLLDPGRVG